MFRLGYFRTHRLFNPRAPCGARLDDLWYQYKRITFQSTGSVWSPTLDHVEIFRLIDFSIHGLRVEPDSKIILAKHFNIFSIHGLRVEPDLLRVVQLIFLYFFNPRAPCGARLLDLLF